MDTQPDATTGMMHSRPGRVSSIDEHSDGKHATVRIVHGKKKKDPETGELRGYHRAESSVVIPKAAAQQYTIGQKVHAGLSPSDDDGDEMDAEVAKGTNALNAAVSRRTANLNAKRGK
jgi:hypothetical protein